MKRLFAATLAASLVFLPSCKKNAPQNTEPQPASAAAEAAQNQPDAQKADELSPENREKQLSDKVKDPVMPKELESLAAKADGGDAEAAEKFLIMLATDYKDADEFHRIYRDRIEKYLTQPTAYQLPYANLLRGVHEYKKHENNREEALAAAKPWLDKAFASQDLTTLGFLLKNIDFEYSRQAGDALEKIYEHKGAQITPKEQYDYARNLEFAVYSDAVEQKYRELLKQSAKGGFVEAQAMLGHTLMGDRETWDEGFDRMLKAAKDGDPDSNLDIANKLFIVTHHANADEVVQNVGYSMDQQQYDTIKKIIPENANPYQAIMEYANKSDGMPQACEMLLAIGILGGDISKQAFDNVLDDADRPIEELMLLAIGISGGDISKQAFDNAIGCMRKLASKKMENGLCVQLHELFNVLDDADRPIEELLSESQRQEIGQILLDCHQKAMDAGDYYDSEIPDCFSHAWVISTLFDGSHRYYMIKPDADKSLSYLVYAARHGDMIAQNMLAKAWFTGDKLPQNSDRACYWHQQAAKAKSCKDLCGLEDNDDIPVCRACKESADFARSCAR